MSDQPIPPSLALREARDRTVAELCEHFARDHLEAEELEQRLDLAYRASTLPELRVLLRDLPQTPADLPTPRPEGSQHPAPHRGDARQQQFVVAVMGGAERRGAWTPARVVNVVAVMGGVLLDFRDARLDPGVTEIQVFALMGGVEILVPPGVLVDSAGIGIMGGFEHAGSGRFPVDTSVPVLRITGAAIMGGVEIKERLPGESGRDARRRLREDRRSPRSGARSPRREIEP